MLRTDWLTYSYTISHYSSVVEGRLRNEIATFSRVCEVTENQLDTNRQLENEETKRRTFTVS